MTYMQQIDAGLDQVTMTLIAGLEHEFGAGAGAALAARFLAAEDADFFWDARVSERWLGRYHDTDEEAVELDRVAAFGRLNRRWFVAVLIIDGEGECHAKLGSRWFTTRGAALAAYAQAH